MQHDVKTLTPDDAHQAITTIVLAFAADPVARWTWPEAHDYLAFMPRLVQALGGRSFARDGAYGTEGYTGAALWLCPGLKPDEEALGGLVQGSVPGPLRDEVYGLFEQMAKYHPAEPHWFLPLIGVDPAHQGKGLGDALMKHALEKCDRDRMPAYLESTNPRNISLYLRHGFEALGTIQTDTSPPIVPMLRRPR